jgi:hypothetical protein
VRHLGKQIGLLLTAIALTATCVAGILERHTSADPPLTYRRLLIGHLDCTRLDGSPYSISLHDRPFAIYVFSTECPHCVDTHDRWTVLSQSQFCKSGSCAEVGLNSTHIRLTEYAASEPTGVVLLFGCAAVQLEALGVNATPTLILIRADHSFLSLPGAIRRDLIKSALGVTLLPTPLDHVQAWFETRW